MPRASSPPLPAADRYVLVDVPGRRYRLAAWTGSDGVPVPLALVHAGQPPDPGSALFAAADAHRRKVRAALALLAARRAREEVVDYLRALPPTDRPWVFDMSVEDPDDVETFRGDVVRHLADAASQADPFRAAVAFERGMCNFSGDVRLVSLLRDRLLAPMAAPDPAEAAAAAREAAMAMLRALAKSSGMVRADLARMGLCEAPPPARDEPGAAFPGRAP